MNNPESYTGEENTESSVEDRAHLWKKMVEESNLESGIKEKILELVDEIEKNIIRPNNRAIMDSLTEKLYAQVSVLEIKGDMSAEDAHSLITELIIDISKFDRELKTRK